MDVKRTLQVELEYRARQSSRMRTTLTKGESVIWKSNLNSRFCHHFSFVSSEGLNGGGPFDG